MEFDEIKVNLKVFTTITVKVPNNAPNKEVLAKKFALSKIIIVDQNADSPDDMAFEEYCNETFSNNPDYEDLDEKLGFFWDNVQISNISANFQVDEE
ncbi:MAG: hypothetical protein EU529_16430 [Promethearchaeota archaeon]|nr:MAG: hypothetical protein EU529_16430 [Candidatus Lokiarchaeota archaeon]